MNKYTADMKYIIFPMLFGLFTACQTDKITSETSTAENDSVNKEMNVLDMEQEEEIDEVANQMVSPEYAFFNGTIIVPPQQHASVTIMMGGTLQSINFLPGERVSKGKVIAKLENPEFINLQQSYLEAVAQADFLETEYLRQQTLSENEAASKKRFQESKAEYLSMKSKKEAAAAQLKILGINPPEIEENGIMPYLPVKAPLNGYITGTKSNLGKYINPGEPICEIVNKNETMLCITAYEKDLPYLAVGNPVKFEANGLDTNEFEAVLVSIGQEIDPVSRSLNVYAKVHNSHAAFRPGMYVTAQVKKK